MTSSAKPDARWLVECGEWPTLEAQRAAARSLLSRLLGGEVSVAHDSRGAPYLPDRPGLFVSLSHCRRAVAAAVSRERRVGIDVESRRRVSDSLVERVCSPDELALVRASSDPTMAFLRLWTRKEAVLKCRGTGIRGFSSVQSALADADCQILDIDCASPDVVASLAL